MFVCLFDNFVLAQEQPLYATVELYVYTENVLPDTPPYTFTITAVSTAFDASNNITTDFNSSSYQPTHNQLSSDWSGWDHVKSQNWLNAPVFASALYKFECPNLNFYFYFDWRDTRYAYWPPSSCTGQCADIWVRYDASVEKFYISSYNAQSPNFEIKKSDYFNIWEMEGQGNPYTAGFQNYWSNCLSAIPKYNNENFLVPFIVWGPIPSFTATGYKIYRSIRPQGMPPGNFSLITTLSSNTFTYLDESVLVNGSQVAYYKVKAYNGSSESDYTNIANISISGFYKQENTTPLCPFRLDQNYPNPFNPTTEIRYSLPEPSKVKIVVMNTLGQEVVRLADEHQGEGEHSVIFNALGLPSGVYFYAVYAGDFTEIKKMIYLR